MISSAPRDYLDCSESASPIDCITWVALSGGVANVFSISRVDHRFGRYARVRRAGARTIRTGETLGRDRQAVVAGRSCRGQDRRQGVGHCSQGLLFSACGGHQQLSDVDEQSPAPGQLHAGAEEPGLVFDLRLRSDRIRTRRREARSRRYSREPQEGNLRGNEERKKRGLPTLILEGWFVAP